MLAYTIFGLDRYQHCCSQYYAFVQKYIYIYLTDININIYVNICILCFRYICIYIVSVVQEIFENLQKCKKSKNKLLKRTRGIACCTYTYTCMQFYTLCVGWLYLFGNDSLWESNLADVSFLEMLMSTSQTFEFNNCWVIHEQKRSFHKTAIFYFNMMKNGDPSSNVYWSFLNLFGSVLYLYPFGQYTGAYLSALVYVLSAKITHM